MNNFFIPIVFFFSLYTYPSTINDREKIDKVVTDYITSITNYSIGVFEDDAYANLVLNIFFNSFTDIHQNDMFGFESEDQASLENYLTCIDVSFDNKLKVDFSSAEILDCSITKDGKSYAYAIVLKKIEYQNLKKEIEFIIGINTTNRKDFRIEYVLYNSNANNSQTINQCNSSVGGDNTNLILEQEHLANAENLFRQKKYIEAKRMYELVLSFNPDNKLAKEGINSSNNLINRENLIEEIDNLIKNNRFKSAVSRLNELRENHFIEDKKDWFQNAIANCEKKLLDEEYNSIIRIADGFFNKKMYDEALKHYQEAISYMPNNSYLLQRIEECKRGDTASVAKILQTAYNNAKKSKKNWFDTFNTYASYENTGFLTGEQYYFMCLMMLENYNQIGKKMGYSRNQTYHLARKYFYKAKDTGYNVSYLENQVFTSNIMKRKE